MASIILSTTRNPIRSTGKQQLIPLLSQIRAVTIDGRTIGLPTTTTDFSSISRVFQSIKQNLCQSFAAISSSILHPHQSSSSSSSSSSAAAAAATATTIDPYFFYDFGGLLKAVPKKKVSHSRKRMRSAHKGIQPNLSLGVCPACGEPKRQHFLCLHCYADKVLERSKSIKTPWEKGITP